MTRREEAVALEQAANAAADQVDAIGERVGAALAAVGADESQLAARLWRDGWCGAGHEHGLDDAGLAACGRRRGRAPRRDSCAARTGEEEFRRPPSAARWA